MGEGMKPVALLPVKAHSERIPGKNFKLLCGQPLWTWTLETLLLCGRFSYVAVDTDSPALMQALDAWDGVRVIPRHPSLLGDYTSMNDIIAYDLTQCPEAQVLFQTHVTNPLLTQDTIARAMQAFEAREPGFDALFSVNRIQARTYWRDGSPINHMPGKLARTQDLEPVFEENSNFFIFTREAFLASGTRLGTRPILFETPPMESLEIDEPEDFAFVELVMRGREAAHGSK